MQLLQFVFRRSQASLWETSTGALKKHHCRHVLWVQRNGCKVSLYPVTVLWKVAWISGLQNWMILTQMKSQDSPEDHTFCCRWNSLPMCSISCQKLVMSSQRANPSAASRITGSTTDKPHLEVGDSTTKFTSQLMVTTSCHLTPSDPPQWLQIQA